MGVLIHGLNFNDEFFTTVRFGFRARSSTYFVLGRKSSQRDTLLRERNRRLDCYRITAFQGRTQCLVCGPMFTLAFCAAVRRNMTSRTLLEAFYFTFRAMAKRATTIISLSNLPWVINAFSVVKFFVSSEGGPTRINLLFSGWNCYVGRPTLFQVKTL